MFTMLAIGGLITCGKCAISYQAEVEEDVEVESEEVVEVQNIELGAQRVQPISGDSQDVTIAPHIQSEEAEQGAMAATKRFCTAYLTTLWANKLTSIFWFLYLFDFFSDIVAAISSNIPLGCRLILLFFVVLPLIFDTIYTLWDGHSCLLVILNVFGLRPLYSKHYNIRSKEDKKE